MGGDKNTIELIARAVTFRYGRVLLVRKKGGAHIFLPGGHIEWGEPSRFALRREILEEMGLALRIGRFLGCVEHAFSQGKKRTHEINLLFSVGAGAIPEQIVSREPKLQFFWQPLSRLDAINLQPQVLQRLLPKWDKSKRPAWSGTME